MYPKLKVELNKGLDEKVCLEFLNLKKAGIDFGEGIIKVHPALQVLRNPKLSQKGKRSLLKRYVNWFCEGKADELEVIRISSQEKWDKSSESFYKACDKYFENYSWPEGDYIGYLSIFNCNPRFLENKTFQVFWKHPKGFVSVAAHEMLHFLFYDYMTKNFSKTKLTKDALWNLSEILNNFLLREPRFIRITNDPEPLLYPSLLNTAKTLKPYWNKPKSVKEFLDKIIPKPPLFDA